MRHRKGQRSPYSLAPSPDASHGIDYKHDRRPELNATLNGSPGTEILGTKPGHAFRPPSRLALRERQPVCIASQSPGERRRVAGAAAAALLLCSAALVVFWRDAALRLVSRDRLPLRYYYLLVPLTVVPTLIAIYLRWVSHKMWRNNE
mmetsp:Transcript_19917/g.60311  ORF Transcript_19917/g.60311 Transcript_19917/m.60311 type:complete len:148 (-) Transcript_19917:94-537(-)